jgi:hypothetical protein
MDSPTLWPRTCRRLVMSQQLGSPNRYRAPSLRSLWPYNNTQLISPKNMSDSQRIMNNSVKWSWTWDYRWLVRVHPLFGRMVLRTTSLLLLQRCHCSSLIFICTNQIVMNIWILYYSILFLHISVLYNFICLIIIFIIIILYNFILIILYNFIF